MENMSELIKEITDKCPNCQTYKKLDEKGNLLKQLELIDGSWTDVTEKEQEKIRLEKEILENKNLLKRFGNNDI